VAMIPALILFVGMLFLPETPRWLYENGHAERARAVLRRVLGGNEAEVNQQIQEIEEIRRQEEQQERVGYAELLKPFVRPALIVGVGLAIFQQITGINTVIYYAPTTLEAAGFSAGGAIVATSLGVGVVNVGFTILSLFLIDRLGRRPLLLIGITGMVISLFLLGLVFALGADSAALGVLATVCLALYIASFAISLGPVFWLMISEIYPLNIRGKAMSVASLANWGSNFIVSLTFLLLINALGQTGTFWLYGAIGVVSLFFVYFLVPETKGRSLEQIEADFRGTPVASSRVR
jgi:sugar porter (SP) family MFS transporter